MVLDKGKEFKKTGLLVSLNLERGKYTSSNESVMQELIDQLVKEGIYPSKPTIAMEEGNYTILDMVNSWGVNWYEYEEPLECPYCKANLRQENSGPPFKREIAMSNIFLDRVVDCVCPDCYRSLNNGKKYDKEEFDKANNTPPLSSLSSLS